MQPDRMPDKLESAMSGHFLPRPVGHSRVCPTLKPAGRLTEGHRPRWSPGPNMSECNETIGVQESFPSNFRYRILGGRRVSISSCIRRCLGMMHPDLGVKVVLELRKHVTHDRRNRQMGRSVADSVAYQWLNDRKPDVRKFRQVFWNESLK